MEALEHSLPESVVLDEEPFTDDELIAGPVPDSRPGRWHISDDAQAEWAMQKLAKLRAKKNRLEHLAEQYVDRVSRWLNKRLAVEQVPQRIRFFEAHLMRYAIEWRKRTGMATLHLPSGVVKTRQDKTPKVVVANEPAVIEWAKANLKGEELAAALKVTEKVSVTALRAIARVVEHEDGTMKAVTADGEVIPGTEVQDIQTTAEVVPA